jgi:hypothetical protein
MQVMRALSHTPPPPLGQGWREGGETDYPVRTFSRPTLIRPKNFPAILISVRKNPGVRTFVWNFFGSFRFQTGKKPTGKFSAQKFSGQKNFAAKKSTGFRIPCPAYPATIYNGEVSWLGN